MPNFKITKTKKIVISALLLAMFIVLDRLLSINTQTLAINFSLIPIMIAGMLLGPYYAALICGLGDLIGSLRFPFGPYNVGFTISAVLTGFIYGIFLYEKPNNQNTENSVIKYNKTNFSFIIKVIISNLLITLFISILLDSLWLNLMYKKAYGYFLLQRVIAKAAILPINIVLIVYLKKLLHPYFKKYLYKIED